MFQIFLSILFAIEVAEVLPNPEGPDLEQEYIILKNTSETEINLEGYYLDDQEGESPLYCLEGHTIAPLGELTLTSQETGISINNDRDEIRILDSDFKEVMSFEIEEALEGITYPLTKPIKAFDIPTSIIITEIMANPEEEETTNEWIELQNTSLQTINLAGLLLDDSEDGSTPFELPEIELGPSEFTIIYRSESGLSLNNSSDSARILTPDETVIDEVKYEKTKEGLSYQLIKTLDPTTGEIDQIWEWNTPSPEAENTYLYTIKTVVSEFDSESETLTTITDNQTFQFRTTNLETSEELTSTILAPGTEITLTYQTIDGENQITNFEIETQEESGTIIIENEPDPLYKRLLPYITTILATVLLSIYEIRSKK